MRHAKSPAVIQQAAANNQLALGSNRSRGVTEESLLLAFLEELQDIKDGGTALKLWDALRCVAVLELSVGIVCSGDFPGSSDLFQIVIDA